MKQNAIFDIQTERDFLTHALSIFNYQYQNNKVYHSFCNHLNVQPSQVKSLHQIPFLPIEFFKSKRIVSSTKPEEILFTSSGTTGSETSKHYVTDVELYENASSSTFATSFKRKNWPLSSALIMMS